MLEKEQIRKKLLRLHEEENSHNIEVSKIDKLIKTLKQRKIKLAKLISKNMKYRNILINKL